jgi:hypothetical protein
MAWRDRADPNARLVGAAFQAAAEEPAPDFEDRVLAALRQAAHGRASATAEGRRSPTRFAGRVRRLLPLVAGVLAALLAVNAAGSYFVPRYADALATAPAVGGISDPVLRWAGLSAGRATALGDTATANGHTLRLVAGRADELRTVLIVQVDDLPPGSEMCLPPTCTDKRALWRQHPLMWGIGEATLTDQFGHSYQPGGVGGGTSLSFQPLAGPAASVGARLSLHVTHLLGQTPSTPAVSGDWTLRATLFLQPAAALRLPPAAQAEGNTYTLTSARASGLLVVHWTATGPAVERVRQLAYAGGGHLSDEEMRLSKRLFDLRVTGPDGRPALAHDFGFEIPRSGAMRGEGTFEANQPGMYQLRFGTNGPQFALQVPPA